jgi:beta-glucosidase
VRAVAAANPNTVVVLETGGPVLLPWAGRVRAIVQAWYPGQEGGDAIARVLLGAVNPAGRLPQTFPRRLADVAVRAPGQLEGVQRRVPYAEGLRVGYRRFDALGLRPRFPFGHGLSYTSFGYRGLTVRRARGGGLVASVLVRNRGRRAGDEVPQLYLRRPGDGRVRSLAAFARVRLAPGAERRVRLAVTRRGLSRWDGRRDRWRVVPGCHRIEVGASSRDVRATATVAVGRASACRRPDA